MHGAPRLTGDYAWGIVAMAGTIVAVVVIAAISYGTNTSGIRAAREPLSIARKSSAISTTGRGGATSSQHTP